MTVISWWMLLCGVAALNVALWALAAKAPWRHQCTTPARLLTNRLQIILSAGYVFGCAFRSVVPVYDVPRMALWDSWISSAFVGRSVATIAEICFAAQWALITREAGRMGRSVFTSGVAMALVPLIAIAEACSWYSVLTTSNLGHVLEESIWGFSAALVVMALALTVTRGTVAPRVTLVSWCAGGIAYVTYIFSIDVPMYWARWVADESAGHSYLSISQGVFDALHRRVVSHEWSDWHSEVVWMSLYFSVAVWISISLIHAPTLRPRTPAEIPGWLPIRVRDAARIGVSRWSRSHAPGEIRKTV